MFYTLANQGSAESRFLDNGFPSVARKTFKVLPKAGSYISLAKEAVENYIMKEKIFIYRFRVKKYDQ